jgi:VWFA-related protein
VPGCLTTALLWACLFVGQANPYPANPMSQFQQGSNPPTPSESHQVSEGDDTVRLESNLVNVFFTVTDGENRLVNDLTKKDVAIIEENAPQPIEFFKRGRDLPMVLALAADFSGSQEWIWSEERDAARQFFNQIFRPGQDYVAVASFRNTVQLHTGLTSSRERLDRVFQSLARTDTGYAHQGTALYDAVFTVMDEVLDGKTALRISRGHHFVDRRALLLLTDGRDTASLRTAAATIARAHRALIHIYAIGIGDGFRFAGVDRAALDQLCQETGGRAYYPRNPDELRWAFREIAEELTTQYVVGFYSTNAIKDGSFRKIRLDIPGRKDLTVRYRSGYYARTENR